MIVIINFCGPTCSIYTDSTDACSEVALEVDEFRKRLNKGWFYEKGCLVMRGKWIKSKRGGKTFAK